MAKTFSGERVIKILCRSFEFSVKSQKGSHVKLEKQSTDRTITTIVPLHKELAHGTLKGVLDLAEIIEKDFIKAAL